MPRDKAALARIYDRTSGYCHICKKKLALTNYGRSGARGAWEIEHSVARANGGTERLNNLYAACISCNRSKGKKSSRSARGKHGRRRAPLSREKRAAVKSANTMKGAVGGALVGARFGGPGGAILGGLLGAALGSSRDPDED